MLVYIDESGHPHPQDPSRNPVLLAVCISRSDVNQVARQLYTIKRHAINNPDFELKANKILNRRTFRRIPEKRELIEQVFDMARNLPIKVFGVIMERPSRAIKRLDGLLPNYHRFLLSKVNMFMKEEPSTTMRTLLMRPPLPANLLKLPLTRVKSL